MQKLHNSDMSSQWTVTVSQRLDSFLADLNPHVSRSRVQKMIRAGGIEVNGEEVTKPSFQLREGDSVFLIVEWEDEEDPFPIVPLDLRLPVLYEDADCLVIHKPAGYAVHPGAGMAKDEATILHGIAFLFEERGVPFLSAHVLVHRLDRETTGCLLIAKTPDAHGPLQKQFARRDVSKIYLALVVGRPDPPKAVIDAPVGRNLTDRTRMSVLRTSVSREAKTTYRTLESVGNVSLLQCHPHTGRTHQIRVHLSSIGHVILGDTVYGSPRSEKLAKQHAVGGLCLHAWRLTFLSPTDVREISVEAPLPASFVAALDAFGISQP